MNYEKGNIAKGIVSKIEPFGIFVKLEKKGYNGLIHISEITNGYVSNINDFVSVNDLIYVKLISDPDEHKRIDLSIKDIDYKYNNECIINTKNDKYSFGVLEDKLPIWINEKLKEVKKS